MRLLQRLTASDAPAATLVIRVLVGAVFLSEGIQKLLFPAALGVGRFTKIGIPAPAVLAPFVGAVEVSCGISLLAGLLVRCASLPLLVVMCVAIWTTKVPMFLKSGFWATAHEGRADWSMLLGCLFLLIAGAGPLSLDARIARRGSAVDG